MSGYEKLAGLMTKHSETATFQRFDFLNTLNILYLQAELVHLEKDLKDGMREDLESGNHVGSESVNGTGSLNVPAQDIKLANNSSNADAECNMEKWPVSNIENGSISEDSGIDERVESGRDWFFLANTDKSTTWKIVLKTRDKLKEYSSPPLVTELNIALLKSSLDEAILRYKELKTQHSPNSCDLEFLRRWFKGKNMGDFPLIGQDSTLWETSSPSDPIAVRARRVEDPLGTLFLSRIFLWWHNCIGHRIKKPVGEEARYFEYEDKHVLRIANVIASIISSALLVGSIMALYFVDDMLVRLGIVAAFTQVFSLVLILATSARKIEVFGATAA